VGAVVGGSLTITLEILRRRWQRQDAQADVQREQHDLWINERKVLYPQLLAKGSELDYICGSFFVSKDNQITLEPGQKISWVDIYSKLSPAVIKLLQEFEFMRSQVEIVGGEAVVRLTKEWDSFLVDQLSDAITGRHLRGNNPQRSLVQAMRVELEYVHLQATTRGPSRQG
jgi:hypothetical protein